jgi:hypothetical protein
LVELREKILSDSSVDRSAQVLTDGKPVPEDRSHTKLRSDGQQEGYVVLTEEERSKGFVRPVRTDYVHVGIRPKHPLRDLTAEEHERYDSYKYVKFEAYAEADAEGFVAGRYWTQDQLNSGCGTRTIMGRSIAETYARDPGFYGGTFCCGCGRHFSLEEFVWDGTTETVGS